MKTKFSTFLSCINKLSKTFFIGALLFATGNVGAQVTLEEQVKITDFGLHFNGKDLNFGNIGTADTSTDNYDYFFGRNISAHGDAVKIYKNYVFMTWYRGGKQDRHMMLSRYNRDSGAISTIEFPHQHTGFRGDPNIGESHNTIGLAVSPNNGTIHMVFDMHAYDDNNHSGKFKDDFFRYTYSVAGAADLPDDEFTLAAFVKDTSSVSQGPDDYKHLTMTGDLADKGNFARLTYPKFFTNTDGTLLLYMRLGGNNNGAYVFNRYDEQNLKWSTFTKFNHNNQKSKGNPYNWGLYGNMKYVNGKLSVGFQQRSSDNNDKYLYQNGVYYAYSDHPEGFGDWKNHKGESITYPLVDSDEIKIYEPGDYITHQEANSVYIVGDFDWTVTNNGDIHTISKVRSTDRNRADYEQVYIHAYKPNGAEEFIVTTDFTGASSIYTSGENIYIIGLSNGYPYVEKAQGGTNDFVRVYEVTEGTRFDHGTIHIQDGKVYYYLMERASGAAMPLHLQIINLNIESDATKPVVSFPQTSMTVEEGYESLSFSVQASSPESDRNIVGVELFVDGNSIRTDGSAPYVWGHKNKPVELVGLAAGTHIFKAVATDSEGATGSATMFLKVTSKSPTVSFPESSITVELGYEQLSFTVTASSPVEGRTITKVDLYANDTFIRTDSAAPFVWGHKNKPNELLGLPTGTNTFTAIATDSEGVEGAATMTLVVKGLPQPPVVTFPQDVVTVYQGYEKLSVTIQAESPVEGRTVESVTLYRNGEFVRKDTRPVWNFGHGFAPYELGAMGWLDRHDPNPNPLGVGVHKFTAVAVDNAGLEGEGIMTLIVKELPAPTINFVESDIELTAGYDTLSLSVDVETSAAYVDVASVGLYLDDVLIREVYEAPYTWGDEFSTTELLDVPVGSHIFKAVVADSNNRNSEATITVTVSPLPGDLDGDVDVDFADVVALSRIIRNGNTDDLANDYNNDGVVDSLDVRALRTMCTRARCSTR